MAPDETSIDGSTNDHESDDRPLRPDIAAAKARMSGSLLSFSIGGQLAFRRLEEQLSPTEEVLCLAPGHARGKGALAVLTSTRVLVLRQGLLRKGNYDIALDQVSAVSYTKGFVRSTLSVHSSGGVEQIEKVQHGDAETFVARARERIGVRPVGTAAVGGWAAQQVQTATTGHADVLSQIRALGELREAGVLSEEEFQAKKQALLDRL